MALEMMRPEAAVLLRPAVITVAARVWHGV